MSWTYALVVDNLDDDDDFASVWSCAEECDTADLHVLPVRPCDVCVAHLAGCVVRTACQISKMIRIQ